MKFLPTMSQCFLISIFLYLPMRTRIHGCISNWDKFDECKIEWIFMVAIERAQNGIMPPAIWPFLNMHLSTIWTQIWAVDRGWVQKFPSEHSSRNPYSTETWICNLSDAMRHIFLNMQIFNRWSKHSSIPSIWTSNTMNSVENQVTFS